MACSGTEPHDNAPIDHLGANRADASASSADQRAEEAPKDEGKSGVSSPATAEATGGAHGQTTVTLGEQTIDEAAKSLKASLESIRDQPDDLKSIFGTEATPWCIPVDLSKPRFGARRSKAFLDLSDEQWPSWQDRLTAGLRRLEKHGFLELEEVDIFCYLLRFPSASARSARRNEPVTRFDPEKVTSVNEQQRQGRGGTQQDDAELRSARFHASDVKVFVQDLKHAQFRFPDSSMKTIVETELGAASWKLLLQFALNDGRVAPPDHRALSDSWCKEHTRRGQNTDLAAVREDLPTKRAEFKRQRDTWMRRRRRLNEQLRELLDLKAAPFEREGDQFVSRFKVLRHDVADR